MYPYHSQNFVIRHSPFTLPQLAHNVAQADLQLTIFLPQELGFQACVTMAHLF